MTANEVLEILQNKRKCVNGKCNHKCIKCQYFVSNDEVDEAYGIAIGIISRQMKIKQEFFKSGIEFAKTQFIRRLENEKHTVGELHKSKDINDLVYTQVLGLQKAIEIAEELKSEYH